MPRASAGCNTRSALAQWHVGAMNADHGRPSCDQLGRSTSAFVCRQLAPLVTPLSIDVGVSWEIGDKLDQANVNEPVLFPWVGRLVPMADSLLRASWMTGTVREDGERLKPVPVLPPSPDLCLAPLHRRTDWPPR